MADIFDLYIRALGNDGDFYRRLLASSAGNLRYSNQAIGVDKMALFMKEIAKKGGLKSLQTIVGREVVPPCFIMPGCLTRKLWQELDTDLNLLFGNIRGLQMKC